MKKRPLAYKPPHGFSLIEALVALLLLSSVGLAAMQLHLRQQHHVHHSLWQLQGWTLATDLAARLRLHASVVQTHPELLPPFQQPLSAWQPHAVTCAPSTCSPQAAALQDLSLWQQQALAVLPPTTLLTVCPHTDSGACGVAPSSLWQLSLGAPNSPQPEIHLTIGLP